MHASHALNNISNNVLPKTSSMIQYDISQEADMHHNSILCSHFKIFIQLFMDIFMHNEIIQFIKNTFIFICH